VTQKLPIVLVHGTMGKSEDWSRVVGELSKSRPVIRPDYTERVGGRNPAKALTIKDLADEVVAAVRYEGVSSALILLAARSARQLPPASRQSIRN